MSNFIETYFKNVPPLRDEFIESTLQTLYMAGVTALIAGVLGIILGVILVVTDQGGILENKYLYSVLDKIINIFRSIPFIIMLAAIVPFTRWIAHTSIGTTAAIVPLVVGTTPFFARQIQNALVEVDAGIIEAAQSMGSSPLGIIFRVYLKEGLNGIIRASSLTIINLIGLTAMAGAVGGGGLGNLAISRGYNRFNDDVTFVATLIILAIVFITQAIGNYLIRKTSH
ncbi:MULTISPECIES: methionine ABC transporter permease [Carnobacterium]|jgi:D-methionine transport system permease protein|uniref:Binding--dependent transport system inner membrane component family protein n=2 Tax=Carnobacterium maltaromaticum TaxID=2751 RepID=K8E6A1_CARML|nr:MULTISPECIES: methionine ABC transporter permease [Carnobacterium]AOA02897.1 methionine ABC transporter permease [Carnobacterium maltaromaticum]KRN66529.1 ABC transporter, permease protein [Carnobacterium maltaromaticum DSM 20342]KRN86102.1 ABC transporter, permease protein [Carnobacterium maltaromaticum]MBC9788945.1 ABC transporter permease subunit [Carnobacterium maltaromaticum]MBC9809991.1 ABC transporter permease subunit [Carnobacterium maltaromaticum]